MKEWWPRIVILGLLALIVGAPLLLRREASGSGSNDGGAGSPAGDPGGAVDGSGGGGGPVLVIISPHNEQIRHEFGRAFNEHRRRRGLSAVRFDWRTSGGTSDLRKQVLSEFESAAAAGRIDQGVGYDLFFGGGDFEHNMLAGGVSVRKDGKEERFSVTVVPELPEGLLEQAFPEPVIGGERLYHPKLSWIGVALSSFGIVYNRDVLAMEQLEEPRTWADLAAPGFMHKVALADPGHSGSIGATFNVILRRMGWTEGWATLRRVFANARYFTASADKVPVDVSAGESAAGMCIDFYGRFQSGAIGPGTVDPSLARVGYIDPAFKTAVTADPISILRGAPSLLAAAREGRPQRQALANEFVVWLLTQEAQGLWQKRRGAEGGPERFELRRLPVRRDMYAAGEMASWTDAVDPWTITRPFAPGMPDFYRLVEPVTKAMAIDVQDDLSAAWSAIHAQTDPIRKTQMLALFDAMPPDLTLTWPDEELRVGWLNILEDAGHARHDEAAGIIRKFIAGVTDPWKDKKQPDRKLEDRLRWTLFFRDRYRRVAALRD